MAIAASSAPRFFIVTAFLPVLSKPWLLQSPPHHLRLPQQPLPPPIPSTTPQTLAFCSSDLYPRPQVPQTLFSLSQRMNTTAQSAKLRTELNQHFSTSLQSGAGLAGSYLQSLES